MTFCNHFDRWKILFLKKSLGFFVKKLSMCCLTVSKMWTPSCSEKSEMRWKDENLKVWWVWWICKISQNITTMLIKMLLTLIGQYCAEHCHVWSQYLNDSSILIDFLRFFLSKLPFRNSIFLNLFSDLTANNS